jgi:hypothetical protein
MKTQFTDFAMMEANGKNPMLNLTGEKICASEVRKGFLIFKGGLTAYCVCNYGICWSDYRYLSLSSDGLQAVLP